MFCVHCGSENPENAEFCFKCGRRLFRPQAKIAESQAAPGQLDEPRHCEDISGPASEKSEIQVPPLLPTPAHIEIKPLRVLRDVAIITVVFLLGRFIALKFFPPAFLSQDLLAITAGILLSFGFFISGCLTVENRWKHLWFVALGCCLESLVSLVFLELKFTVWLMGAPLGFALVMGLGGAASALVRRPPAKIPALVSNPDTSQPVMEGHGFRLLGFFFFGFGKYAIFSGRARRAEYWWFFLCNLLVAPVALFSIEAILDQFAGRPMPTTVNDSILVGLYRLATLIPVIAVSVRRMHDTDHSGWWALVPIANLVLAVTKGDDGRNDFGPDPLV